MIHFLIVVIVLGALLYLALIYTSYSLVLLYFFAVVFVLLAFAFLLFQRSMVKCRLEIPIAVADEGSEVSVLVHIRNKSPLSLFRLKICLAAGNTFSSRRKKVWMKVSGAGMGEQVLKYKIRLPEAGNIEIRLQKIRLYDMMGLLFLNKREKSVCYIQVLPKIEAIPVKISESVRNFYGESDKYDEEKSGYDHSEIFRIRTFMDGDKLQSIHWKISAKSDELMVKENSFPKACAVVLLLDYRKKKGKRENIGDFLKLVGSLSFSLMDMGCPHYISWYEEKTRDITRIRVDDEESYYMFLAYYLQEQGSMIPGNLIEQYNEKYRMDPYLYSLRITEDLTIFKNGMEMNNYQKEKATQGLGGMEIVL